MSDTAIRRSGRSAGARLRRPSALAVLAAALLILVGLLVVVRTLPIGPMYWDLFIYFDAANRIFDGQAPARDFFAPVGPLGYWLFAGGLKLLPQAQPLLLVDWSMLLVTAPLMAVVLRDAERRSRVAAFALLAPFLVFSILPFNVEAFSSYPGVDGFGIYNRQAARLLYVLAAALVFCAPSRRLGLVVAGAMLALFLTKITGFVAGGLLCLLALPAGRLTLRATLIAVLAFSAALTAIQLATGSVAHYVTDIAVLVSMNEESLAPRILQAASVHLATFAPAAILSALLFALSARPLLSAAGSMLRRPNGANLRAFFDRDEIWLATAVLAALLFETQNTGGQAFIFVWPMLLAVVLGADRWRGGRFVAVLVLVAATALPTMTSMLGRAGRAMVGQVKYERVETTHLKTLGAVTQRSDFMRHADTMLDVYARFPRTYEAIAERGELPSFMLFSEPDYQIAWLKAADRAVGAIRAYEAANGTRFETMMTLDFVNPFPWLLDRHATKYIAIGADPSRAVPAPNETVAQAVGGTDLVLYPTCPVKASSQALLRIYEPFLTDHRRVTLDPCWDAFVRARLAPRP